MIRANDFIINSASQPSVTDALSIGSKETASSDWIHSIHYLNDNEKFFKKISKGCQFIHQISHLKPIAIPMNNVIQLLGQTAQLANFYVSFEDFSILFRKGKLGCNLESVKEITSAIDKGIDLINWFSLVEKLNFTVKATTRLTSMSLGIALLSPTIDLIRHLREEGMNAFQGIELYKISYNLGLSLLAIYLFVMATTVSTYLDIVIKGIELSLACPEYFDYAVYTYEALIDWRDNVDFEDVW